jgi:hypothetical protein
VEPLLLRGGQVVKSLSVGFLADFEQHWRTHGRKVLDILAEKYPQAYFAARWRWPNRSGGKQLRRICPAAV